MIGKGSGKIDTNVKFPKTLAFFCKKTNTNSFDLFSVDDDGYFLSNSSNFHSFAFPMIFGESLTYLKLDNYPISSNK